MKKILIITALWMTAAGTTLAQNSADALRYSRIDVGGTARFMGLSGAFGALGADITTMSTNPAGIGLFKSSEFSITPAVHTGAVESTYYNTLGNDARSNFYLGNLGMVLSSKSKSDPKKPGWRNVNFATGLNRLADFNNRYDMYGTNPQNSLLDTYVESANGTYFGDIEDDIYGDYAFDLNLAWWTYLLDFADPVTVDQYISPIPLGVSKTQAKSIDTRGSMNEYVFSLGANYNDRLYLGMTFGIPFIRYWEESVYTESNIEESDLDYFNRYEDLETRGSGFNFKLGFIYRANDWFRIGGAFHTPSWFNNMKDYWQVTMVSQFKTPDANGDTRYVETSPSGYYEYSLQTPYRIQGSLGFIIGNVGLVSTEYEFADYAKARMDAWDYNFSEENSAIRNSYQGTHHIRLGTEWRYQIFSFRAGAKYYTSPYQNDINDGSKLGFSGGVGLRQNWFFMDLTYAYSKMEEDYYFYNNPLLSSYAINPVLNNMRTHSVLLTLGAKL